MSTSRQRRIAFAIVTLTVLLSSFFLAQGSTRLVAAALFTPSDTPENAAQVPIRHESNKRLQPRNASGILRRNIFDSESGDLTQVRQEAAPTQAAETMTEYDPNQPIGTCSGGPKLVGALADYRFPDRSVAAFTGVEDSRVVFREGMQVAGKTLVAILQDHVVMQPSGGPMCAVHMFDSAEASHSSASAPVTGAMTRPDEGEDDDNAVRATRTGLSEQELDQNINKIAENKYTITRQFANRVLGDQAVLMRVARIIPKRENGRVTGINLYGIRNNDLLGKLGMENGDMLRTINGFDMTSPTDTLEAYSKLRNADRLTVSFVRRGKPMTLEYDIR